MKPNLLLLYALVLIVSTACKQDTHTVTSSKSEGSYQLMIDGNHILSYQFATYPAPAGEDALYARSGFIHPLKTLSGHTLTQIQPPDHYHHYGIWNPWTHVLFEGDTLDFWNLHKGEGLVRFAGFEEETQNGFSAIHEHAVLKDGKQKVALREIQTVQVQPVSDKQYVLDFTLKYNPVDSPFKILEYRYAGFSIRATEQWNGSNSEIISSEVNIRDDIDGTTGKWVMAQGSLNDHIGGFLLMSHPENFNHPEPLRVWPEANHNGLFFINFSPTKTTDWLMEPGQTYTLRYRIVVSDGEVSKAEAETLWADYASN